MARLTVPGAIGINRQHFADVDNLINSMRTGTREWVRAMDLATRLLAHTTQGFAMKQMSGRQYPGPSQFEIPVRVVTGRTRAGWLVKRVKMGSWEVYNEERGAWMVEHGIIHGGSAPRRPVLKNAGVETLRFVGYTRFGQRIMADTFGNLRNNKGQFRNFDKRIRPFLLMYAGKTQMAGPMRKLPE